MEIASCRVKISEFQDVPKNDVTPAEAMVLAVMHKGAGAPIISDLKVTGTVDRDSAQERARLAGIYRGDTLDKLFPGSFARLPEVFSEVPLNRPAPDVQDPPEPKASPRRAAPVRAPKNALTPPEVG